MANAHSADGRSLSSWDHVDYFRKTGKKTGEGGDDGAAAPHAGGGGEGSCDPSTGSADAVHAFSTARGRQGGGALR